MKFFYRLITVLLLFVRVAALPLYSQTASQAVSQADSQAQSQTQQRTFAQHLYITRLQESAPPQYHAESDSLVFTYQSDASIYWAQNVGIAFEHENFSTVHSLGFYDSEDSEGNLLLRVFYYFLALEDSDVAELGSIRYRLIVDGLWIQDPQNPNSIQKISGRALSLVDIPSDRLQIPTSPVITGNSERTKTVLFYYNANPGDSVFLAGNFNNWDPFMYPLSEDPQNPGRFEITIRLLPGSYQYNYYYKGRRIKDPLNQNSSYDIEGYEYSAFTVGL